jgi:hypothetical protein
MYFARKVRSVPIVLPARGAVPAAGTNRRMYVGDHDCYLDEFVY